MSPVIIKEVNLFFQCLVCGIIVIALYDVLRALRRVVRHGTGAVALEDAVYWIFSSIFIFSILYRGNDGSIRGFAILSAVLGMFLYHITLSDLLVKSLAKVLEFLVKPFAVMLKFCRKILRKYRKNLQKSLKELIMSLLS